VLAHLKIQIFTCLMGLGLWITAFHTESITKGALENKGAYKHLLETKQIAANKVSPNNKPEWHSVNRRSMKQPVIVKPR